MRQWDWPKVSNFDNGQQHPFSNKKKTIVVSGVSKIRQNRLEAGAPPRTPLVMGGLQRSLRPSSWWEGTGYPLPNNITPLLVLRAS